MSTALWNSVNEPGGGWKSRGMAGVQSTSRALSIIQARLSSYSREMQGAALLGANAQLLPAPILLRALLPTHSKETLTTFPFSSSPVRASGQCIKFHNGLG